jgi:hypothetical protein
MKDVKTVMGVDENIDDKMLDMVDKLLGDEDISSGSRGQAGKNTPIIMVNNIPLESSSVRHPSRTNNYYLNCNSSNNPNFLCHMKSDIPRKGSFETFDSSYKKLKQQPSPSLNNPILNWGEKLNSGHDFYTTPPQIYVNPPGNGIFANYQNFNPIQNKSTPVSNNNFISHQNSPTTTGSRTFCTQYLQTQNNSNLTTRSHGYSDFSASPRSVNSDNTSKHNSKKNCDELSRKLIKQLFFNTLENFRFLLLIKIFDKKFI